MQSTPVLGIWEHAPPEKNYWKNSYSKLNLFVFIMTSNFQGGILGGWRSLPLYGTLDRWPLSTHGKAKTSVQSFNVWVSAWQQSWRCSQNLGVPFLNETNANHILGITTVTFIHALLLLHVYMRYHLRLWPRPPVARHTQWLEVKTNMASLS